MTARVSPSSTREAMARSSAGHNCLLYSAWLMEPTRSWPENVSPKSVCTGSLSRERTSWTALSGASRASVPKGHAMSCTHQSRKSSSAVCCPWAPATPCSDSGSVRVSTPSSTNRPTFLGNWAAYTAPSRVPYEKPR